MWKVWCLLSHKTNKMKDNWRSKHQNIREEKLQAVSLNVRKDMTQSRSRSLYRWLRGGSAYRYARNYFSQCNSRFVLYSINSTYFLYRRHFCRISTNEFIIYRACRWTMKSSIKKFFSICLGIPGWRCFGVVSLFGISERFVETFVFCYARSNQVCYVHFAEKITSCPRN